mmetsp:Transcript_24642/g.46060  ORF Transcript_24642/g.46060 Transcript_24642/m.46060 type:complete len:93 (-) Transcript_24642:177-455(-)
MMPRTTAGARIGSTIFRKWLQEFLLLRLKLKIQQAVTPKEMKNRKKKPQFTIKTTMSMMTNEMNMKLMRAVVSNAIHGASFSILLRNLSHER